MDGAGGETCGKKNLFDKAVAKVMASLAILIVLFGGVAIANGLYIVSAPLPGAPPSFGPFAVRGQNNEPVGILQLNLTGNGFLSVDNPVHIDAKFEPFSIEYKAYVVWFPDSRAHPPRTDPQSNSPALGQVVMYEKRQGEFVGSDSLVWIKPGVHGFLVYGYDLDVKQPIGVTAEERDYFAVAPFEAFQSAVTNQKIIGLAWVGVGIAIIQAYSPLTAIIRRKQNEG